jgi:hypothetical protein
MILLCLLFKEYKLSHSKLLLAFGIYILAKVFELMDESVLLALGIVSGHTIKHLLAALTLWVLLKNERTVNI